MSRPIRRVPRDASLVPASGLNNNQFIPNQFVPGQLDPRVDPRFASNPALAQALATRQPLTPSQIQSLSQLLTPSQLQAVTRIISRVDPSMAPTGTRATRSQTALQNQTILQRLTNLETGLANLATQLDRLSNIECRLGKLEECFTKYPTSYGSFRSMPSSPHCAPPCSVSQTCCSSQSHE